MWRVGLVLTWLAVLSACATPPDADKPPPPPMPTSLTEAMELANSLPACKNEQAFETHAHPASTDESKPVFTYRCIPNYPKVLEKNGYVAACYSAFDINDDGATIGIVVKCNTDNAFGRQDAEELDIAHSMTNRMMYRAVSEMRFVPPTSATPKRQRVNIIQPLRFEMDGMKGFPLFPPKFGETLEGRDAFDRENRTEAEGQS